MSARCRSVGARSRTNTRVKIGPTSRITELGGQSREYFIGLAQRLGFAVRIAENRPLRAGIGGCGERLCSRPMSFVWHVIEQPGPPPERPMAEVYAARAALECIVRRYKPAHTEVRFHYVDYLMDERRRFILQTEDDQSLAVEIYGLDDAPN